LPIGPGVVLAARCWCSSGEKSSRPRSSSADSLGRTPRHRCPFEAECRRESSSLCGCERDDKERHIHTYKRVRHRPWHTPAQALWYEISALTHAHTHTHTHAHTTKRRFQTKIEISSYFVLPKISFLYVLSKTNQKKRLRRKKLKKNTSRQRQIIMRHTGRPLKEMVQKHTQDISREAPTWHT
jgi:hypothetical protein